MINSVNDKGNRNLIVIHKKNCKLDLYILVNGKGFYNKRKKINSK